MVDKVDIEELKTRLVENLTRERQARLQIGRDLILAKSIMRRKFGKWIEEELELCPRSAQRLMNYARSVAELEQMDGVTHDTVSYLAVDAICALASAPEIVQRAIVEDIQIGIRPTSSQVKGQCAVKREPAQTMCAAAQDNKITSYPSLKSTFGDEAALAAQKALTMLEQKFNREELTRFSTLLLQAGTDAICEAISRRVQKSTAAAARMH